MYVVQVAGHDPDGELAHVVLRRPLLSPGHAYVHQEPWAARVVVDVQRAVRERLAQPPHPIGMNAVSQERHQSSLRMLLVMSRSPSNVVTRRARSSLVT